MELKLPLPTPPSSTAEEIRYEAAHILKRVHLPKPNLTRRERAALREVQESKDVCIVPADKGTATAILDSSD
jgi:hypothetical protein